MIHYGQDGLYQAITTHCYPDTHIHSLSLSLSQKGATYVQEFNSSLEVYSIFPPLVTVPVNGHRSVPFQLFIVTRVVFAE